MQRVWGWTGIKKLLSLDPTTGLNTHVGLLYTTHILRLKIKIKIKRGRKTYLKKYSSCILPLDLLVLDW